MRVLEDTLPKVFLLENVEGLAYSKKSEGLARGAVQRQVGNAVPSLLGEVLARAIRVQLLGRKLPSEKPVLLPPDRGPAPSSEPIACVPKKFHVLKGQHAPHPGTGQGYRASAEWASQESGGA
jgi:hypothetical protein